METQFENWKTPAKKFRPLVRWWWPGMDIDPAELLKELGELDDRGFGGAEIQSFLFGVPRNIKVKTEQIHRFAPHSFYYEILKIICEEAKKRGLIIDLTIGSSWPAGGTHVSEENSLQTLLMGTKFIRGGKLIETGLPEIQLNTFYKKPELMKRIMGPVFNGFDLTHFSPMSTVAIQPKYLRRSGKIRFFCPKAFPLKPESIIDLNPFIKHNKIEWLAPPGFWQIFTVYAGPSGSTPMLDAKGDPNLPSRVVDLFNLKRIYNYLDGHLLGAKELLKPFFGNPIRALFTDSQEIASEWFWTDDFFKEFKERRGYDVKPYIPVCFVPNRDNQFLEVIFQGNKPVYDFPKGEGARIRYDWLKTLSELWAEKYCQGVSDWGKQYGILHRIQTYGITLDLLKAFGAADIPETEQLYAGGILDFLKLAGSAGIIYQKPVVSCESMVWRWRDRCTTPLKMKVAADRLFVAGINQLIFHGFPYCHPEIPYPNYNPWGQVSSNFNRHNPFWDYFPQINNYIARGQYLMRQGTTVCQIAILYHHFNYSYKFLHNEDLVRGHLPGFDPKPPRNIMERFMSFPKSRIDKDVQYQQKLGEDLMEWGYFYIQINEEKLLEARIQDGRLIAGDAHITTLIIPRLPAISLELVKKIESMAQTGISIIFLETIPTGQPGFQNYRENDRKIQNIMVNLLNNGTTAHFIEKSRTSFKVGKFLKKTLKILPQLDFTTSEKSIKYIHKCVDQDHLYFLRHSLPHPYSTIIGFSVSPKQNFFPQLLNIRSGQTVPISYYWKDELTYRIPLSFTEYGENIILFQHTEFEQIQCPVIIKTDLPIKMQDSHTMSICFTPGTFAITDSLNKTQSITIKNILPKDILLDDWGISIDKRERNGSFTHFQFPLKKLIDWRKHKVLRYCTGPAEYKTVFSLTDNYLEPNLIHILKFGKICDAATIYLNGKNLGVLIYPPYELKITEHLLVGTNELKVILVGTLRNRLVGYGQKRELVPVGLIGPVKISTGRLIQWES